MRAARSLLAAELAVFFFTFVAPSSADEVYLWIDQSIVGQNNLLRTPENPVAEGSYEVRPGIGVRRDAGELRYRAEYEPSYSAYFTQSIFNGWDHRGRLDASYEPNRKHRFFLDSDLASFQTIRSEAVDDGIGVPEVSRSAAGRAFRLFADLGYEAQVSRKTAGRASFGVEWYDFTNSGNVDSLGFAGELGTLHAITEVVSIGATLTGSHRRFDERAPQPASNNTILYAGGALQANPIPSLFFEAEVGPAVIRTQRSSAESVEALRFRTRFVGDVLEGAVFDDCGSFEGFPLLDDCPFAPTPQLADRIDETIVVDYVPGTDTGAVDDVTVTAFARAELRHEQDWGSAGVSYVRLEDGSSATGATTVRDSVTAEIRLEATGGWTTRLRGNWNKRRTIDELIDVEVTADDSGIASDGGANVAESSALIVVDLTEREVTQYWAELRVEREFRPDLLVELSARYLRQTRNDRDTIDTFTGRLTLRYQVGSLDFPW